MIRRLGPKRLIEFVVVSCLGVACDGGTPLLVVGGLTTVPAQRAQADDTRLPTFARQSGDHILGALPETGVALSSSFAIASTASYWSDDRRPAHFVRLNDRVLIGRVSNLYDGSFGATGATWLSKIGAGQYGYLERSTQMLDISTYGEMAATFAARTSDNRGVRGQNGCCAMPLAVVAVNDDKTANRDGSTGQDMWGLYETMMRLPKTGRVLNEQDVMNATPDVVGSSPYNQNPSGATIGQVFQAGGEMAFARATVVASLRPDGGSTGVLDVTSIDHVVSLKNAITPGVHVYGAGIPDDGVTSEVTVASVDSRMGNVLGAYKVACAAKCPSVAAGSRLQLGYVKYSSPASAAAVVSGNGQTFDHGFVCAYATISNADPSCLDMAIGQKVKWAYDSTDAGAGWITATADSAATANGLEFSRFGALFRAGHGSVLAQIAGMADPANYLVLNPGAQGHDPSLVATGSDADVDLNLSGKNKGLVAILGTGLKVHGAAHIAESVTAASFREKPMTPTGPTAPCSAGEFTDDASYHYVCIASNTWKRSPMSAWGRAPVLSSAGASSSLSESATDDHGTVTEGLSATGFTLTFGVTYSHPRDCIISSPTGTSFRSYSAGTTHLTLVNASNGRAKFTYLCSGE